MLFTDLIALKSVIVGQAIVITHEFVEHGKASPQLTVISDELSEPEQLEGPEQVVSGAEQIAPLIIETDEVLKLRGSAEGETHA